MKQKGNVLVGLLVIFLAITVYLFLIKESPKEEINKPETPKEEQPQKLKIIDTSKNLRPYAVMINNINVARFVQSGLQDAYLVYEMVVEGGITRMMAIFNDSSLIKVGSVRSARHYYLDYALENDAIYIHWGESPQASSDFKTLKVDHIDGMASSNPYFYRDTKLNLSSEHTGFVNLKEITKLATNKNFRLTTNKKLLLNYKIEEIDLKNFSTSKEANNLKIVYSSSYITSYKYNPETKTYLRSVNGKSHIDYETKKQYEVKNIITYQVQNSTIVGGGKGRQELDNIGKGEGLFISNGFSVPITWEKSTRSAQTIYRYKENNQEIEVNDGNTFIQIQPQGKSLIVS